jgi:hypothetical protein
MTGGHTGPDRYCGETGRDGAVFPRIEDREIFDACDDRVER